jgi:polysaccharide pyruvyl transferase CsaB
LSGKREPLKKILIAGYYGYNNAGDEAILQGILAELRNLGGDIEFTVLSGNPERTHALHDVNAVAWSNIPKIVEVVKTSSLVIVGGGGLIQDYWGVEESSFLTQRQGGISEFGAPILLANLFGIPCMFYAVGVGPLKTPDGKKFTKLLFEAADHATVRDKASRELLKEIGVKVTKIPIVTDPAFYAIPEPIDQKFQKILKSLERPIIGVSLRYWDIGVDPLEWHPQVSKALDQILEEIGGTVVLMPFHVSDYFLEDDERICIQVLSGMEHKQRAIITGGKLDPIQRFGAMTQFDLVLGMRLHSLIGALYAGTPSVGLMYDPKVGALLQGHKLEHYCLPLSGLDGEVLLEHLVKAFENKADFEKAGNAIRKMHESPSGSFKSAEELLKVVPSEPALPPLLIDFAIQQTMNLAVAEDQLTQLNTLFLELWSSRDRPGEASEFLTTNLAWIEGQLQEDQTKIEKLDSELGSARERLKSSQIAVQSLEKIVHQVESDLREETEKRKTSEETMSLLQRNEHQLRSELDTIKASRGYKILQALWGILWRIRAPRQALRELRANLGPIFLRFKGILNKFSAFIGMAFLKILPGPRKHLDFIVNGHHLWLDDRSKVSLYTDDEDLFPDHTLRYPLRDLERDPVQVTLVTTVKNEAENAREWLKQLEGQSRVPDEVILLDGGSKDNTFEILKEYAAITPLNLKLSSKPGSNIATRRNLGAEMASHPVIAMTDFGCNLRRDWLEKIIAPFEHDAEMEVVAGWYQATSRSRLGEWAKNELIPTINDVHPQTFLPACRSIAFRKSTWEKVGGFAEWLTKTGEDTHFDLQLKRNARNWAFVPEAQVIWHAPSSVKGIWDKLSSWTVGDGESGAFAPHLWEHTVESYRNAVLTLFGLGLAIGSFWVSVPIGIIASVLWLLLVLLSLWIDGRGRGGIRGGILKRFGRAARVDGFLRGFKNRPAATARRYADVTGVVLFLTGVPIDDTGGGARGTQIALELLRRDNLVIFVHKYPKQESVDLELDFSHENLLHFSSDEFNWDALKWELGDLLRQKLLTAILEFPFQEYLPIARSVSRAEGQVVYDLIDEWNTSLGGEWYSSDIERRIMARSGLLVASAPSLVERLKEMTGRSVLLLPNAVNLKLFDREQVYDEPEDLRRGEPRILYIGALWGEWFDWDLLQKIAQAYPNSALTIIGDYRGQCPFHEPNLHFLGLKPQTSLPAYLQHSDVTIIPWEISSITQATSPLKVFEYLAMAVPVVAPRINPLVDLPYVFTSSDHSEFIMNIEVARKCEMDEEVLDEFIRANSWEARIDKLAENIGGI